MRQTPERPEQGRAPWRSNQLHESSAPAAPRLSGRHKELNGKYPAGGFAVHSGPGILCPCIHEGAWMKPPRVIEEVETTRRSIGKVTILSGEWIRRKKVAQQNDQEQCS